MNDKKMKLRILKQNPKNYLHLRPGDLDLTKLYAIANAHDYTLSQFVRHLIKLGLEVFLKKK